MEPIAAMIEDNVTPFTLPCPDQAAAAADRAMDDVAVGYDGKPVLRNLTLRLDPDDRIALLGANGNGKSTFAKLLAGRLAPSSGEMRRPAKLTAGYFAQHQLDELSPARSPMTTFAS